MPARGHTEPVALMSADPTADRLAALRKLFPECWADGAVDFDKLRAALGDAVAAGPERFTFSWNGRADAAALLRTPSRATLVPKPDQSVNWDATRNLFVEGDNLEVLKLLYKGYAGRVKLIYIDPPYNTGQDFVYPDDFADPLAVYLKLTGQADDAGKLLTGNPETSGRYHSAWLSMMYPRLFLARQFLRDDGVICVSIDDHEVHHLRLLMNEVFGEENFVAAIAWQKEDAPSSDAKGLSVTHEYILLFQKSEEFKRNLLPRTEEQLGNYKNPDNDPRGVWIRTNIVRWEVRKDRVFELVNPKGRTVTPPPGTSWRFDRPTFENYEKDNKVWWGSDGDGDLPFLKRFLTEVAEGVVPTSWWEYEFAGSNRNATVEVRKLFEREIPFDTPKPTRLISRLLQITTSPASQDLVLDFFAGSCTAAHAVLELNREDGGDRRFVMVQLPEPTENKQYPTIAEIGKERIRRVIRELAGEPGNLTREAAEDLGFKVFALGESHFEPWAGVPDRDPAKYADTMEMFLDPLKPGADPVAVVWELAVKEGYGLNTTVVPAAVGANTVYTVTDGEKSPPQTFRACLDERLAPDIARQLGLSPTDLFVCRDAALDDTLAANLALQCRLKTV
jgi:adenine-specific DNA-methyltransferase